MYNSDCLEYHGIKGMKWGVRRYQNYDGSYTKAGVARYHTAETNYEKAKENARKTREDYKSGKASKIQYTQAKSSLKKSKRDLNAAYDKLKTDKLADQGKQLYKNGKTITNNSVKNYVAQGAVVLGSAAVSRILSSKIRDQRVSAIASAAVAVGGTIVNGILYGKTRSENKKLRAYYAH